MLTKVARVLIGAQPASYKLIQSDWNILFKKREKDNSNALKHARLFSHIFISHDLLKVTLDVKYTLAVFSSNNMRV